jgi:membrane-associated protein
MIELFHKLFELDLNWIFEHYQTSIYTVLFLVIFIETGFVIMPFLPGDSLLFTAGIFAAQSDHLDIKVLAILLFIAAILGDALNYFIGKTIGLKVLQLKWKDKRIIKQEYIDQTHNFYEKHGPKTIIIARFVPIVRTFAPFVAGIAEMTYRKFISFNIIGGALWICLLLFSGYFLGGYDIIKNNISKVALIIIAISVLPIFIELARARFGKKNN